MKHGFNTDKDKKSGKGGKADEREIGLPHSDITEAIIGAAFEVYGVLGYRFLERVYQRAMQVELQSRGFAVETESDIQVIYQGVEVGYYKADLLVNRCVIAELKVAKAYCSDDESQLLNELTATGVQVGLLVNFGSVKVDFKRFAY